MMIKKYFSEQPMDPIIIIIHYYHNYEVLLSLSSFVIIKTILNIFFVSFFRVSHRVAFTQRESFKNYSPQSGTVILKLFLSRTNNEAALFTA